MYIQIGVIQQEMEEKSFFWENLDPEFIQEIITMVKPYCPSFVSSMKMEFSMLETRFLDEICSLEFILRITNFTLSLQGTSIFDKTQDFYTLIYGIIDSQHFQKDFVGLERIYSTEL